MDIATRLKTRRIDLDLKPKEVAHYIKKSEQYVGQLEKGVNSPPTWPLLADIARFYRCSTDWILGLTDEVDPRPSRNLSANERSILSILKNLPELKQEEVIRHAEIVLEIHQRIEKEESEKSLFQIVLERYESGEDDTPRIIGDESDDSENE